MGGQSVLERHTCLYCFKFTCCSGLIPPSLILRETFEEVLHAKNTAPLPVTTQRSKALFLTSKTYFCPTICYLTPLLEACLLHSQCDLLHCMRLTLRCSEAPAILRVTAPFQRKSSQTSPQTSTLLPIVSSPPVCLGSKLGFRYRMVLKHLLISRHTSSCRVQLDYSYT